MSHCHLALAKETTISLHLNSVQILPSSAKHKFPALCVRVNIVLSLMLLQSNRFVGHLF